MFCSRGVEVEGREQAGMRLKKKKQKQQNTVWKSMACAGFSIICAVLFTRGVVPERQREFYLSEAEGHQLWLL